MRHSSAGDKTVSYCHKEISRKTLDKRLKGRRLCSLNVLMSMQDRTAPLQWYRDIAMGLNRTRYAYYSQMRVQSSDCRCELIWSVSGTAYRPGTIQERDRFPICSVMVWISIMINTRNSLRVVVTGNMTGQLLHIHFIYTTI